MRVKDFKAKLARSTEGSFEAKFASALSTKAIYSRHMSDRNSGVFDRYISSGIWVELKSIEKARGMIEAGEEMSPAQHAFAREMQEHDECWYLAKVHVGKDAYICFMPYHVVQEYRRNEKKVDVRKDDWCHPYKTMDDLSRLIPRDWYA